MKIELFSITISLIMIAVLNAECSFAQPPGIEWDRIYGGNSSDEAYSVQQTSDGGYVFTGYTRSFTVDSNDVYLVKTDSIGNVEWYRIYGGEDYDAGYCVQRTNDSGYIVVGRTRSFGSGSSDMYSVRTNSEGDTLWTHTYGGIYYDEAQSVQQTLDEGYILVGRIQRSGGAVSEMYLVKTDASGDTLWTRSYGGNDDRAAYSVQQISDGGYIVAGHNPFYPANEDDIYIVRTDSIGDTLWTRAYGGEDRDHVWSIRQTLSGGFVFAGETYSFGAGATDMYVVNIDSQGDTLWTRTYGGSDYDEARSITLRPDGGYVLTGSTSSYGAAESDLYMIRIDSVGNIIWNLIYGGPHFDYGRSIDHAQNEGYVVAGFVFDWELPANAWLVKTGPDTAVSGAPVIQWVSHPKNFTLHPAYPNLFNPTTTISFDLPIQSYVSMNVYNVLGQRVGVLMDGTMSQGIHRIRWDASAYPSGIYFVKMTAGEFVQTRKVVLLK